MSLRRGIEPIIATVILVAVALIIAVAVVGYLMGLFGGLTGGQPQISITSITAKLSNSDLQFEMYLSNAGAGSDKLVKVEVIAGGKSNMESNLNDKVTGLDVQTDGSAIVRGNYKGWVTLTVDPPSEVTVAPGDTVILKLYFERSGIQTINVIVSPS